MAKTDWAVHVVAYNGQDSFGFKNPQDAEGFRKDLRDEEDRMDFVSSVIRLVPGETYWVVHVKNTNGKMQSFGFDTKVEAIKFKKAVLRKDHEGVALVSAPVMAELRDDAGVLDWTPED